MGHARILIRTALLLPCVEVPFDVCEWLAFDMTLFSLKLGQSRTVPYVSDLWAPSQLHTFISNVVLSLTKTIVWNQGQNKSNIGGLLLKYFSMMAVAVE